jgi:three-Cys-motif partner protein
MANDFFEESKQQSVIKTTIVAKYFDAWARVMRNPARSHGNRLGYIDLFSGPGRYDDGTKSTPIVILGKAIGDKDLSQMLVTIFNDSNKAFYESLNRVVLELPGIDQLKYKPVISNAAVGPEVEKVFSEMHLVPSLIFLDPWGYKGLTLDLFRNFLKDWGCELIFFFNYNRINMGLGNPMVVEHMNSIFGRERADILRKQLEGLPAGERELTILNELTEALQGIGGKYVLPFSFKDERGARTTHHLVFAGKHIRGYEIMKDVMAGFSVKEQGVPSFEYNPADERYPALFEYSRPLDDLSNILLKEFAGKSLTMVEIYDTHNVGTRFIKKNYKHALMELERESKITTEPAAEKRRSGTFADHVRVTVPEE